MNTPQEAIKTFLGTGIEYLFLENNLVSRRVRGQPNRKPAAKPPDNAGNLGFPEGVPKPGVCNPHLGQHAGRRMQYG